MNKKGGFFIPLILIFLAITAIALQNDPNFNIQNTLESIGTIGEQDVGSSIDDPSWISSILFDGVNFLLRSIATITQNLVIWVSNNTHLNWNIIFWGAILAIFIPVFYYALRAIILIFILVSELRSRKRDKKNLEKN